MADSCGMARVRKEEMSDATFSPCGRYRYTLRRRWLLGEGSMLWILLNPSTATATVDDPTIRRCIGYSKLWGFREMLLLNIFAFRATDPKAMRAAEDPVGPDNMGTLEYAAAEHDFIVAGWGDHGALMGQGVRVRTMITGMDREILCLGKNKSGEPRHPLYQRKDLRPVRL